MDDIQLLRSFGERQAVFSNLTNLSLTPDRPPGICWQEEALFDVTVRLVAGGFSSNSSKPDEFHWWEPGTIRTHQQTELPKLSSMPMRAGTCKLTFGGSATRLSGYQEPDQVGFFVREKQADQDPESVAAKVLLKKVAETYRSLSAARFESETFLELAGQQSAMRRTTLSNFTI